MRHRFNPREGMDVKTSTPQQRKEIHQLLEDNGYRMFYKTEDRSEYDFERYGLVCHEDNDWICSSHINKVYTYEEMKALITGEIIYEVY